jgi:hypothetical protein
MQVAMVFVVILVVATVQGRPSADLESSGIIRGNPESSGIIRGNPDKVEIIRSEREEQVPISPTVYKRTFCTKVLCAAF